MQQPMQAQQRFFNNNDTRFDWTECCTNVAYYAVAAAACVVAAYISYHLIMIAATLALIYTAYRACTAPADDPLTGNEILLGVASAALVCC